MATSVHGPVAMAETGERWKTMASGSEREKILRGVQRVQGDGLIRLVQRVVDGRGRVGPGHGVEQFADTAAHGV